MTEIINKSVGSIRDLLGIEKIMKGYWEQRCTHRIYHVDEVGQFLER